MFQCSRTVRHGGVRSVVRFQGYQSVIAVRWRWEGRLFSSSFLTDILNIATIASNLHFYKQFALSSGISAARINYNNIMELIKSNVDELRNLRPAKFVEQTIALIIIVGSALALWKSLCVSFNTECPVVVVLTGSMEPGYYRGDILFVTHWDEPIVPGDVLVYSLRSQPIPIVHRAITVQEKADGDLYILTKGDNNNVDDRGLYAASTKWLHRRDIMGKMRAYLPYMGMFTIWLNDYTWFKFLTLGLMGFFVLIAKDPQ